MTGPVAVVKIFPGNNWISGFVADRIKVIARASNIVDSQPGVSRIDVSTGRRAGVTNTSSSATKTMWREKSAVVPRYSFLTVSGLARHGVIMNGMM